MMTGKGFPGDRGAFFTENNSFFISGRAAYEGPV